VLFCLARIKLIDKAQVSQTIVANVVFKKKNFGLGSNQIETESSDSVKNILKNGRD